MFYQTIYPSNLNMTPQPPLSNIHPEDINCIIRSSNSSKGSLYVSNLQGAQNLITLQKLKIKSILTCAQGYKLDHSKQIIKYYKYIPLSEIQTYGVYQFLHQAADFIQNTLSMTNVMVHSLTGQGRAIVALIAYFIKYKQMNYSDAYKYLQRKRNYLNFNASYQRLLKQFQKAIKKQSINEKQKSISKKTEYSKKQKKLNSNLKTNQQSSNLSQIGQIGNNSNIKQKNLNISRFQQNQTKNKNNKDSNINNSITQDNKSRNTFRNNSFILQNQNKRNKNQSVYSVKSKQAKKFQNCISSHHEQYNGIKRSLKNSQMSFKKQKRQSQIVLNKSNANNNSHPASHRRSISSIVSNYNNSSSRLSNEQIKSLRTNSVQNKLNTQRSQSISQRKSNTNANIFNPQDIKSSYSKGSKDSKKIQRNISMSPSKINYFKEINQSLNFNIKSILDEYQIETKNVREKYHKKLRNIRLNGENLQSKIY